jgi:D-beta-D-heptose 7-phosphate kinase/D-beta-D-heptose 1-phosphate adenosyltransferase
LDRFSVDRVSQILEAARSVRALVVGDLMLDKYITGTVERISPEAPVPVVRVESESSAIGGAANVAANVVALGAKAGVVGCVGSDENGVILRAALKAAGVSTDGLVETESRSTTVKTRVLARHQQVVRVDREVAGDVDPQIAARLAESVARFADQCDVLILEDYNKGVLVPAVINSEEPPSSSPMRRSWPKAWAKTSIRTIRSGWKRPGLASVPTRSCSRSVRRAWR